MKDELEAGVAACARELFDIEASAELTRPDERFGDYATNIALQLAKRLDKNPREVAESIAAKLRDTLGDKLAEASVAGPGFINLKLSDAVLQAAAVPVAPQTYAGQVVVTEYSDPNPFKVLHAGHLYTSVVGASISNLIAAAGGEVHRVNFGGDVGLHAAKTMWAILQELGGEQPEKLADVPNEGRSEWMAGCYVAGTRAYEEDEAARSAVTDLNKRIYQLFTDNDHESPFAQIYWTCRQWSYDYFNAFYDRIGTPFEKYYPESEVAPLGLQTVRDQLQKGVYQESDGAVVFDGERYGLHTRVFINSHGLPTYEAKDVGLLMKKWQDYHFDRSVVITGNDIEEYMKVVLKSVEQYEPDLVHRTTHFTHGNVKLQGGVKMSSRKGNFLRAVDVLDAAAEANKEANERNDEQAVLGAVKYSFLKQRIGADIIYNPQESVSLEGNSGPYLQYAHARARSVLGKADEDHPETRHSELDSESRPPEQTSLPDNGRDPESADALQDDESPERNRAGDLQADERSLLLKISEYNEVLATATRELMPHHICTYLYELAQIFNRFYEHNRVIGDERQLLRLELVEQYADILRNGLALLGIPAPDKM